VAERGPFADELVAVQREVSQVPVQAGVEARREPGRDVRGEHRRGEEHGVRARALDERRKRVDAWLRKRRGPLRRLPHRRPPRAPLRPRSAVRPGAAPGRPPPAAEPHAPRPPERRGLREAPEPAVLERTTVVLEEDERLHMSFLSTTRSKIFCAPEPSSSNFTWSPREGGGPSSRTTVFAPPSPAALASTPTSANDSVSCGFVFAPMIPLSDGYRGSLI